MLPLLAVVFFGGWVLLAACFAVGMLGVREFYRCFETAGVRPSYMTANISLLVLYGIGLFAPDNRQFYMFWVFLVMLLSFLYLFRIGDRKLEDGMVTATGIFYVCFFSFHVVLTDQIDHYGVLIWLIFLSSFGTDIAAYFTGYFFGRHKLCPDISPKKTVEGSVGGILGSLIICGFFGYLFARELFIHCLIIGALGGVLSQAGDLTASVFKRKLGVKDYGDLIPGHGGVLDRFDSVLFTAPMVYYYIVLIM
jgi:phosphatidate cytidylyltransferase